MCKKIFLWILLFVFLIPLSQIKADGCFIPMDYQDGDIYEPSQTALIGVIQNTTVMKKLASLKNKLNNAKLEMNYY